MLLILSRIQDIRFTNFSFALFCSKLFCFVCVHTDEETVHIIYCKFLDFFDCALSYIQRNPSRCF